MHLEKFTRNAAKSVLFHCSRDGESKEDVEHSNKNIDKSLSYKNYNLAPKHKEGDWNFIKKTLEEKKALQRSDLNCLCSWAISAPKELKTQEDAKKFFQATYDFLNEKYPYVVSSWVHLDETYSSKDNKNEKNVHMHMHYAFIPVKKVFKDVFDEESGILKQEIKEKVSAKETITRNDLKVIHKEYQKYLNEHLNLGYEVNVNNGATVLGVKGMEEYKKMKELQNQNSILTREINDLRNNTSALIGYNSTLKKQQKEIVEVIGSAIQSFDTVRSDETSHWINQKFEALKNELYGSSEVIKKVEKQEEKFQKSKDFGTEIDL